VLDIALFGGGPKIQATMKNEISSAGRPDSSGRGLGIATNALLGVLAALVIAQLAPWGDGDKAGTGVGILAGAVAGIVAGRLIRPKLLIGLEIALLAIYLLIALTPIMTPVTDHWVRNDALPADTLDAIVALSAGVKSDSALNTTAADRLISALELMREGRARRLVTTRQIEDYGWGWRSRTINSDVDQRRLISLASLAGVWIVVDSVHTTRDEALRSAARLLPEGARSIIVVTSPMHTRRACAAFEAVGFRVVCRASRERDFATNPPVGNRDRLAALRAFGYEQLGMIKYRVRGWLTSRTLVTPVTGGSS
jgi:uncharacterized SAM-binding protein YcdF (DUF218 family)